jgi:hypothetical protein
MADWDFIPQNQDEQDRDADDPVRYAKVIKQDLDVIRRGSEPVCKQKRGHPVPEKQDNRIAQQYFIGHVKLEAPALPNPLRVRPIWVISDLHNQGILFPNRAKQWRVIRHLALVMLI